MPVKLFAALLLSACTAVSAGPVTIETTSGSLLGQETQGVSAFLGVPYGADTGGMNRWQPPQPVPPWQGVRDATAFGPDCFQAPPHMAPGEGPWTNEFLVSGPQSEDCLFINIWAPASVSEQQRPVLVWIHGGAFAGGSGSVPIYHGRNLAREGIVVVTLNYRLGVFGFLAHPELTGEQGTSGNYGLLDQIAALEWVKANIDRFGGDPSRITIAGQSAGAASVHALMASPLAQGLFVRAIAQSGSGMGVEYPPLAQAEQLGQKMQETLQVNTLDELRAAPAQQVLDASLSPGIAPPGLRYTPVQDSKVLPDPATSLSNIPVLTGYTADETSAGGADWRTASRQGLIELIQRRFGKANETFMAIYGVAEDAQAQSAARTMLRDRALAAMLFWADDHDSDQPVYGYLFNYPPPGPPEGFGSFHTAEVPYTLSTLDVGERHYDNEDRELARIISRYWINFVTTGNPNGNQQPTWPSLTKRGELMVFDHRGATALPALSDRKQQAYRDFADQGGVLGMF